MKRIIYLLLISCICQTVGAQSKLQYFGLAGYAISDLDINYGLIAVGTDRQDVHWQFEPVATPDGWMDIRMDSSVMAVYPHKSGPLGWAIGAGIQPATGQPPFVFCSHMGDDFAENSDGIDPSRTSVIRDLDGFPDPSICGETFGIGDRAVYRRNFGDTTWQIVYDASIEGYLQTVKVHEFAPGVVLAGGADGFAGILLIRSFDFGATWENISPFGMVFGIDFVDPVADTIFVAASNMVFRTWDGGANWDIVLMDGLSFHLSHILYDPDNQVVYTAGGTFQGNAMLMASYDLGENWLPVDVGDLGTINGLERGNDDWIYFSTLEDGVYRFRDGTTTVINLGDEAGKGIALEPGHPNPVNGMTRIVYEISESSRILLNIFNTAGEAVEELVNSAQPAGQHSVMWDASQVSAGAYLISLQSGGHQVTRRIVVVH